MDYLIILTLAWIILFILFIIALQFMYGRRPKLSLKNAHILVSKYFSLNRAKQKESLITDVAHSISICFN